MRSTLFATALLVLLAPGLARAQAGAAAPVEDRPADRLEEVERGLYLGVEAGGLLLFGPEASAGSALSPGRTLTLTVGGDLGELLSLGLVVMGAQIDTPADFVSTNGLRGDFSTLVVGGLARLSLYGRPDGNGIKRFFVSARAGGGVGLMGPKDFFSGSDVVVFGGAGIEYFTHLRHFSIGLNADLVYGLNNLGAGVMLAPMLRYTF